MTRDDSYLSFPRHGRLTGHEGQDRLRGRDLTCGPTETTTDIHVPLSVGFDLNDTFDFGCLRFVPLLLLSTVVVPNYRDRRDPSTGVSKRVLIGHPAHPRVMNSYTVVLFLLSKGTQGVDKSLLVKFQGLRVHV